MSQGGQRFVRVTQGYRDGRCGKTTAAFICGLFPLKLKSKPRRVKALCVAADRFEVPGGERWRNVENMVAWLMELGGECSGAVRLSPADRPIEHEIRMVCTREVRRGDQLVRVPECALLSIETESDDQLLFEEPRFIQLSYILARECNKALTSRWSPYLGTLPSFLDYHRSGGPLILWSDEELQLLDFPYLFSATKWRQEKVDRLISTNCRRFIAAHCLSRAFLLKSSHLDCDKYCLIPLIDLVQHSSSPNAFMTVDSCGDVTLIAAHDIVEGQEVLTSYGNRPVLAFLSDYGFIPESTRDKDQVLINISPVLNDFSPVERYDEGELLRHPGQHSPSTWQPVTPSLYRFLAQILEKRGQGVIRHRVQELLGSLVTHTQGCFLSDLETDCDLLESDDFENARARLACRFRVFQKQGLQEIADRLQPKRPRVSRVVPGK